MTLRLFSKPTVRTSPTACPLVRRPPSATALSFSRLVMCRPQRPPRISPRTQLTRATRSVARPPRPTPRRKRLVGSDRYATSIVVARELFAAPSLLEIATGTGFADALSAGPVAGLQGAPLILVAPTGPLPGPVQSYFNRYSNTVLSALLYGGTSAVSTSVANEIAQALVLVPSSS